MNTKLISFLLSICLACILIILGEWLFALWSQSVTLASLSAVETKSVQDEMPHIDLHLTNEESYADLVARPLFIKGRRPVAEPTPEEIQNTALVPVVFEWDLSGVYSTQNGLSAFLSRTASKTPKDKYRKINKDAELDGWKLKEIYPDRVIFTQGIQSKELLLRKIKNKHPSRKNNITNSPNTPPVDSQAPDEADPENSNE